MLVSIVFLLFFILLLYFYQLLTFILDLFRAVDTRQDLGTDTFFHIRWKFDSQYDFHIRWKSNLINNLFVSKHKLHCISTHTLHNLNTGW